MVFSIVIDGDTMIDPVRLAIQTIMIIWKERLSGWYGRSLELLLYIHQKHPTIQPLKAKQLMSNIKMKVKWTHCVTNLICYCCIDCSIAIFGK